MHQAYKRGIDSDAKIHYMQLQYFFCHVTGWTDGRFLTSNITDADQFGCGTFYGLADFRRTEIARIYSIHTLYCIVSPIYLP